MAYLTRLSQIVTILLSNGYHDLAATIKKESGWDLDIQSGTEHQYASKSERIKATIEELGPTFIKLAQILSTRPDLIPFELTREFEKLQDSVTPHAI